jgi:hypothetical protein
MGEGSRDFDHLRNFLQFKKACFALIFKIPKTHTNQKKMKRFSTLLLTAAVALVSTVNAVAQTADEVIQKHVAAIGGADAWRKVNTLKMTGAVKVQGMEIPVVVIATHNVGSRVNISAMGMDGYIITTPTAGWTFMPFAGQTKPEPMTGDALKMAAEELDLQNDLVDYAKKGHKVELQGKEDIEGTECFKLHLTTKAGQDKTLYIDPSNYYVVREVSKVTVDGKEQEGAENFSNYTKLPEGIVIPMSSEGPMGPMTFTSVEVNKPVEASTFEPTKS